MIKCEIKKKTEAVENKHNLTHVTCCTSKFVSWKTSTDKLRVKNNIRWFQQLWKLGRWEK